MRVVFDTSVLVSALVFPGGRGEAALQRIIEEQDELLLSKPILDELPGILARKFSRDAEELSRVAVFISTLATFVRPRRRLRVVKDDPNNRVLECALTGRAQVIVTGDHALLALHNFRGVRLFSCANISIPARHSGLAPSGSHGGDGLKLDQQPRVREVIASACSGT